MASTSSMASLRARITLCVDPSPHNLGNHAPVLEQEINSWPAVSRHPRVSSTVLVIGSRNAPECEVAKVFVTCTEVITPHEAGFRIEYTALRQQPCLDW